MFKKFLFSGFLLVGLASFAQADNILDVIATTTGTINSVTVNSSSITIASPGANLRNCLTDMTVTSNINTTLTIKDSQSTAMYWVDLSTTVLGGTQPFSYQWPTSDPLCAGYNSGMFIISSTGTAKISYRGQIRGNR